MGTAESIQLVDKLVEAKIPKSTATELVDRIDRGNLEPDNPKWINLESDIGFVKNDVHWLKWAMALGFSALIALMFGIVGIVTYLHNDMKAGIHSVRTEIQSLRTEMKTEINSLRTEMQSMQKKINAKIDQILLRRR